MYERLNTRRAKLLFSIGLNSSQLVFWVLYHAVDIVRKNPRCVQSLFGQLYPEIADSMSCTPSAIDCALRRMCRMMETKERYALLHEHLPAGVVRPTASELMTTWLLIAEMFDAEPETDIDQMIESVK